MEEIKKKKFEELPEKLRNAIWQNLLFGYVLNPSIRNPEEKAKRILEGKEKSMRKWHTFCYWKMEKVKKLREKIDI